MFLENCLFGNIIFTHYLLFLLIEVFLTLLARWILVKCNWKKRNNNFRTILCTQLIFIVHYALCSQDLKVKAAEQKSFIDFIESCVEKMQPQLEDSVTQKSEPRYKETKSLPRFSYVQLPKPTETVQEHYLECVCRRKIAGAGRFLLSAV